MLIDPGYNFQQTLVPDISSFILSEVRRQKSEVRGLNSDFCYLSSVLCPLSSVIRTVALIPLIETKRDS